MKIDAHQHFWRLERGDYGWLTPALAPIFRDFEPADLAPFLAKNGITRTILVQAAPTMSETEYLLAVATATPIIAGVVGWLDFEAKDFAERIGQLASNPLLVGLRPMIQDIEDDEWMLSPKVDRALSEMARRRIVFDALVVPHQLSRLLVIADRHPELTIVVDHGAKPPIRNRQLEPWQADMAALAERPNVHCKLSGLVTEAASDWRVNDLRPYIDPLVAIFGPDRLVWGSDWPVVNLAGGYDRWVAAAQESLASFDEKDCSAVFGGTATRVYLSQQGRREQC